MKNKGLFAILLIVVILVLVGSISIYIIDETEQVIITRFGKPLRTVTNAGIHFKTPFVETVHKFDKRFLEWSGEPNQVTTKDKRYIWVHTYARWQITDPLLFYKRLRDERGAFSRLDDIIDGETRIMIAKHELIELVRTTNRVPEVDLSYEGTEELEEIHFGRGRISNDILNASQSRVEDLGIKILDFQIKRINYVKEVQKTVFERMITERKRIADKYRSEGQGEASEINGEKERELKRIQSGAKRKAQEIMGRADAKAASIYNDAYNKSEESRKFYEFIKTMESYENVFSEKTKLILSTENEFYKYLKKSE